MRKHNPCLLDQCKCYARTDTRDYSQGGKRLQLSAEWLPTTTVVYQPPSDRLGDLITYPSDSAVGPREAAELAQLAVVARTMVPQPPGLERDLSTTYGTNFVQHDTSDIKCDPL